MRPHVKSVVMELFLQPPEKTIAEMLDKLCQETGSEYACSMLHYYYLKRNNITRKVNMCRITYIKQTKECSNVFIAKQNCTTEMRRCES